MKSKATDKHVDKIHQRVKIAIEDNQRTYMKVGLITNRIQDKSSDNIEVECEVFIDQLDELHHGFIVLFYLMREILKHLKMTANYSTNI